jgi:hypothetical protein
LASELSIARLYSGPGILGGFFVEVELQRYDFNSYKRDLH